MEVEQPDPTVIKTVEINPKYFEADIADESDDSVSEDCFDKAKEIIRENEIQPSEKLRLGLDLARKMVVEIENTLGLVEKNKDEMKVALMSHETYKNVYRTITGIDGSSGTSAGYVQDLDEVLVSTDDELDYQTVATTYHEFIHEFVDDHVQVLANMRDEKSGDAWTHRAYARSGLNMDRKITKREGVKLEIESDGTMLNELGNYLEQKRCLMRLLDLPEFEADSQLRKKMLEKIGIRNIGDKHLLEVNSNRKSNVRLRMSQDCLHPDKQGDLSFSVPYFYMQLASDISEVCSRGENPQDFRILLLSAKAEPKKQIELQRVLDDKFGKGFYRRLKRADYGVEDLIDMLEEVQAKLYIE